jgi:acyl-coenzyme A thioesterase PaaI-like protein
VTEQDATAPAPTKPWSGGGRDELADAVRKLMVATVTATASPELITETARQVEALAAELDRYVPDSGPEPATRFAEHTVQFGEVATLASAMPFDMVIGSCNPVALPLSIELVPPKAIGRATFTAPYEGAPGCVHGAVLAGAFDLMLTAANVMSDAAGPTVNLSIHYLKPTRIAQPMVFEAWVTSVEGRRIHSKGHIIQNGIVTVEAVGEFATMDRSRIASMHRKNGVREASGPSGSEEGR